jgi:hypothetical protein
MMKERQDAETGEIGEGDEAQDAFGHVDLLRLLRPA